MALARELLFGPAGLAAKLKAAVEAEDARYAKAIEAVTALTRLNPLPAQEPAHAGKATAHLA